MRSVVSAELERYHRLPTGGNVVVAGLETCSRLLTGLDVLNVALARLRRLYWYVVGLDYGIRLALGDLVLVPLGSLEDLLASK